MNTEQNYTDDFDITVKPPFKSKGKFRLLRVRDRFILRCKIEWLHLAFRFKYPEDTTEPITWLSAYNEYLKKCREIRTKLNGL